MKKVLIISTHFAPDAHIGAKRITKFAKYLPEFGWQPIVLTSAISDYHRLDKTLMDQLPKDIEIHGVKRWHIFPQKNERKLPSTNFSSNREKIDYGLFRRIAGKLLHSVEFLDYRWIFSALIRCRKIMRRHNIDVIFSSSPNPEAHVVPLLLNESNRIPWICEFRDPWTRMYYFDRVFSYFEKRMHRFLELQVLKNANRIVAVSPLMLNGEQSANVALTKSKGCLIYNGYDPEDFSGLHRCLAPNRPLEMAFIGTIGYQIQPEFFFVSLAHFLSHHKDHKKLLHIRIIGEVKEWTEKIDLDKKMRNEVIELGINEIVDFEPFQSHREALRSMLNADILVFILGIHPENPNFNNHRITAKVFEYLYAKRPIIAFIPRHSVVARIINECNSGYIVPYGDIEAAVRTLEQIWEDYESGKLSNWIFNDKEIAKYDRRKQTKQLANIFNELVPEFCT